VPSHGVLVWTVGQQFYAAKVDGNSIDKPGNGERTHLSSVYPGIIFPDGGGGATGGTVGGILTLNAPAGGTAYKAWAVDGNFGPLAPGMTQENPWGTTVTGNPSGLEYVQVPLVGNGAQFFKSYDCVS
jgi:hypothetical protein